MINRFFTADTHFGHENIIKHCSRPFANIEEMRQTMIGRWNEVVKPNDYVFHLGDVAWSDKEAQLVIPRLNGRKVLIPGNHDGCFPGRSNQEKYHRLFLKWGFESVLNPQEVVKIEGVYGLVSHFPWNDADIEDDRFRQFWPKKDDPRWQYPKPRFLLHGHVHEKWKVDGNMINVGVDQWDFRPVHELEIAKRIAQFPGMVKLERSLSSNGKEPLGPAWGNLSSNPRRGHVAE